MTSARFIPPRYEATARERHIWMKGARLGQCAGMAPERQSDSLDAARLSAGRVFRNDLGLCLDAPPLSMVETISAGES